MGDAAAQPVEAPDDESVAGAKGVEEPLEFGAGATDSGGVIGVDPLATGLLERADLEIRILVEGGHTCVADAHVAITLGNSLAVDCVIAMLFARQNGRLSRSIEEVSATLHKGSFLHRPKTGPQCSAS